MGGGARHGFISNNDTIHPSITLWGGKTAGNGSIFHDIGAMKRGVAIFLFNDAKRLLSEAERWKGGGMNTTVNSDDVTMS